MRETLENSLIKIIAERFQNRDSCLAVAASMTKDEDREKLIAFLKMKPEATWSEVAIKMWEIEHDNQ